VTGFYKLPAKGNGHPTLRQGFHPQLYSYVRFARNLCATWGCKPKPRKFYKTFGISLLIRYPNPQSRQMPEVLLDRPGVLSIRWSGKRYAVRQELHPTR
jgi:hypothetical protein